MAIQDAIAWIQGQAATVTGIQQAPTIPNDNAANTTWCIAYPESGEFSTVAADDGRDFHNVRIEILTYRNDLFQAMRRLSGLPEALAHKIMGDPTMGGTVSTYDTITYQFAASEWAGVPVVGYILTVTRIKLITSV